MQVLIAGRNPASYMALRFILIQHTPYSAVKLRIHGTQPVGDILMYGRLRYMKLPRGGAHRRVVLNNVLAEFNGSLLNCSLHVITS